MVEILRESRAASDAVVRWCPACGAVVVDEDMPGRKNIPGGFAKMRWPKAVGERMAEVMLNSKEFRDKISEKDADVLTEYVEGQREGEGDV